MEEFGSEQNRDAYFKGVFSAVEASLKSGGALKGGMFWQFYLPGQVGEAGVALRCAVHCCALLSAANSPHTALPASKHPSVHKCAPARLQTASAGEGGGAGRFGIYPSDSTFSLIKANAAAVQQLYSGPAPSGTCSKKGPAAAGACANKGCGQGQAWWRLVHALKSAARERVERTASDACAASAPPCRPSLHRFEGPGCDIDINECVRGTAGCATGAACINSEASGAPSAAAAVAFQSCTRRLALRCVLQCPALLLPQLAAALLAPAFMPAGQLCLRVPAGHHWKRYLLLLERHLGTQVST